MIEQRKNFAIIHNESGENTFKKAHTLKYNAIFQPPIIELHMWKKEKIAMSMWTWNVP